MKKIKLANKNLYAIVDNDDYDYLIQYKWHLSGGNYAHSSTLGFMHNSIIKCPKGYLIDHKNRNRLDNRKNNFRFATKSQNGANSGLHKNNTSGYRGVRWDKRMNKWRSSISMFGVGVICLGHFNTAKEAARAYDERALKIFGPFAYQNLGGKKKGK